MQSPLSAVVRDSRINEILESIRRAVRSGEPLAIPPKDIDYMQRSFSEALALGERKVYELVRNLLDILAPGKPVRLSLIVVSKCPEAADAGETLHSEFDLSSEPDLLFHTNDTILADSRAPACPRCGKKTVVIASLIRHVGQDNSQGPLAEIITRIKATTNLAYKIADMVFDIDLLFRRDKIYNDYSQVVTDVYGLKIVVRNDADLRKTLDTLRALPSVEVVEEKDYTGARRKKSGFEAYKVVVRVDRQLVEVQIQSIVMYETEQTSRLANHQTYKERQMVDRRKLGKDYVKVYEALYRLFAPPDKNYCPIEAIEVAPTGKGQDDEF